MPKDLSSFMMADLFSALTRIFWLFEARRCHLLGMTAASVLLSLIPNIRKQPCCREIRALLSLARTQRTRCKSSELMTGRKLGLSVCISWSREIMSALLLKDKRKDFLPSIFLYFLIVAAVGEYSQYLHALFPLLYSYSISWVIFFQILSLFLLYIHILLVFYQNLHFLWL